MNKFLKAIEQMGYTVDYNEDISKIKLLHKDGTELESIYNSKTNNLESSYVKFADGNKEIDIFENGIIKIRVNDHMIISLYNEYEINNVYCDYETNNVFFISINNANRPEYSIRIELHKYAGGYSNIMVNVYKSFNNTGKYEDYLLCSGKLSILKLKEGASVSVGNLIEPIYDMSEDECTTENYLNIIKKHINNIWDFSSNSYVQEGMEIILPSMTLFIDELIDYWKDNKNNKTK